MRRSLSVAVLACAAGSTMAVQPVHAQDVAGRVLEAGTSRPLHDVSIALVTTEGRPVVRTATDSAGAFRLRAPRFGTFRLHAEIIGMTTVSTDPFEVSEGVMEVVLRMAETAVPLDPLTVEARGSAADLGVLQGYYERMRWNERAGIGRFITRDAIEARGPGSMSDMLREIPRLSVHRARGVGAFVTARSPRGECHPALFIDGMRVNRRDRAYIDDMVQPGDVEGVEIYVGLAQLPGIYHDDTGCGVLLVWTRRAPDGGTPMTWRRVVVATGIVAAMFLLIR
jgi:hypothetical protein